MPSDISRILPALSMILPIISPSLHAQTPAAPAAHTPPRVEPGLELAVKWKWWVVPSEDTAWGFALPESASAVAASTSPGSPSATPAAVVVTRPESYEVQRGDALAVIARKFSMSVTQLKAFNGLQSDTIRIGQVLKIPTLAELRAMAPPPDPEPEHKEPAKKSKAKAAPKAPVSFEASREMENVRLQAFLDRENFPSGPIDGNPGTAFDKALQLYRTVHEDVSTAETLRQKAIEVVGEPFTDYTLKPEDFRFIAPPSASASGSTRGKSSKSSRGKDGPPPPLSYEELVAQPFLAYRTAWEFVAERFHCSETFLRTLNFRIKGTPAAGTQFQVPNVIPFEIEKAFDAPLQPEADPAKPVTATVMDLNRIEISQGGKLAAVIPMTLARPDLRGRSWVVLDVLPRPRLATKQEPKEQAKPRATSTLSLQLVTPTAETTMRPAPLLESEQHLAAGPNNPLGILWINLAKARTTDPLPYGLHGTSIPGSMKTQESLGGLRVANWDIARIARMLPKGTPLQWK